MAKGNYDRRVSLVVARRGRRAGPGVQPDGGRAGRDRPRAARPRRQRVARAAHADHRAPGRAREPGRRRHRARSRDASTRCWRRSSGSAGWSSSCSTSPASSRARCRSSAPSSASSRCSTHAVREQQLHAPEIAVSVSVDSPDLTADGDPERVHQVVANLLENAVRHTPRGGTVEVRAHAPRRRRHHRGARRRSRHRRGRRGPHLRTLLPRRLRPRVERRRCRASASPSRSGSSTCTAATSIPNGGSRTAAAWSSPFPHN